MSPLSLLLLACASTHSVGSHPLDQASLADTPSTAHLAKALAPGGPTTVGDLLLADHPTYASAPDPSAWLTSLANAFPSLAVEEEPGATPLRVLSYNTGLLNRDYLGGHVEVPEIEARRAVLPERLMAAGYDVLFLQEVWEWSDVAAIGAAGEAAGYKWYAGSQGVHEEHGLMILVRASLVEGAESQEEHQFAVQRRIENWPGPNLKRGWLEWGFTLKGTKRTVRLYATHPQAFPNFYQIRSLQLRELALDIQAEPASTMILLGGDMNQGVYYPQDTFGVVDGKPVTDWWANAAGMAMFAHYSGLVDLLASSGQAQDVARANQLPPYSDTYQTKPLNGACTDPSFLNDTFTATDCNHLYNQNYAGQEYPARIDFLMARDSERQLHLQSTALAFTAADVPAGKNMVELSDHFGVEAKLLVK